MKDDDMIFRALKAISNSHRMEIMVHLMDFRDKDTQQRACFPFFADTMKLSRKSWKNHTRTLMAAGLVIQRSPNLKMEKDELYLIVTPFGYRLCSAVLAVYLPRPGVWRRC